MEFQNSGRPFGKCLRRILAGSAIGMGCLLSLQVQAQSSCTLDENDKDSLDTQQEKLSDYSRCLENVRRQVMNDIEYSLQGIKSSAAAADTQGFDFEAQADNIDNRIINLRALDAEIDSTATKSEEVADEKDFLGWKWGIGVGASFGNDDRISDAEIIDGVVRVNKDNTDTPRIVLEVHNFLWEFKLGKRDVGVGPFAAVNFGANDGNTLTSFGLGGMFGIKRADKNKMDFNLGLGWMLDKDVKVLGAGFRRNQPAPAMATEVRYEEESQNAFVVFITTTF